MSKSTKQLKAAVAPLLKKEQVEKEKVQASRDCLRHGLCPKCGKKMKYVDLPRGEACDDLIFFGEWSCRTCEVFLNTLERARLLKYDADSYLMWLEGEINP